MPASDPMTRPDLSPMLEAQRRRRIVDAAVRNSVARQFSEELHPRVPAGSAGGGQFGAAKGAKKTPAKTRSGGKEPAGEQETSVKQPRTRRKVVIPKGSFGYDPASNHGTGYGVKGGDKNVHTLQQALNRLGFTDSRGRKLTDDGKLGPLTTAAVRKAQRALGVKADGIVSPAFLKQLVAMKAAPKPKSRARKATASGRRAEITVEAVRKFDPMQKRDPDGKWGDGIPGPGGALKDALKLAGRIDLEEDETLAGSGYLDLESETGMDVVWAAVDSPRNGRVYMIGTVHEDDVKKWRAADLGSTVPLPADGASQLLDDLSAAESKANDLSVDAEDIWATGEAPSDPVLRGEKPVAEGTVDTDWGPVVWSVYLDDSEPVSYVTDFRVGDSGDTDAVKLDADGLSHLIAGLDQVVSAPKTSRSATPGNEPRPAAPSASIKGGAWAMTRAATRTRAVTREREAREPAAPPAQIPMTYQRVFPLEGIEILSRAKGGDGRTVEAYAAVFGVKTEVHDQHGDYIEENHPTAFNRTISNGAAQRALVLYNHGYDARGKSGGLPTVPIGHPVEIKADKRGLLTISRYNDSEFTDSVLAAIKNGDIKAQSYEGPIYKSSPMRVPKVARGAQLPLVTRMEMGIRNYGPTPTPYYPQAEITAVRSAAALAEEFARLDEAEREELIRALSTTPGWDPETAHILATPHRGPGAEDPRAAHSLRQKKIRLRAELLARSL